MSRLFDRFIQREHRRWTVAKRTAVAVPALAGLLFSAAEVTNLSLSPTTIAAGGTSTGTASIQGTTIVFNAVSLSSANTGVATVPSSAQVAAKINKATFAIHGVSGAAGCSVISARIGTGLAKTATVFVTPPAATGLLRVSVPANGAVGGTTVNGTLLWMAAPTGGGVVVQLSSNSPHATVPASVTIPPSAINETGTAVVTFPIQTSVVAPSTCAVITGTSGGNSARALLKIATISG